MGKAKYIEVRAEVCYWEDAEINGVEDVDGSLVPFRVGDCWCPVIFIDDGKVKDWPEGTTAKIHYKVCDQGEYWLIDEEGKRIARWKSHYVPDDFLCHGEAGYSDYIILNIGSDGKIEDYEKPEVVDSQWTRL